MGNKNVSGRIYCGYFFGISLIASLVVPFLCLLPIPILGKVVREQTDYSSREIVPVLKGIFTGYTLGSFMWSWVLVLRPLPWRMTILSMIMVGVVAIGLFWLGWFMSWAMAHYRLRQQSHVEC